MTLLAGWNVNDGTTNFAVTSVDSQNVYWAPVVNLGVADSFNIFFLGNGGINTELRAIVYDGTHTGGPTNLLASAIITGTKNTLLTFTLNNTVDLTGKSGIWIGVEGGYAAHVAGDATTTVDEYYETVTYANGPEAVWSGTSQATITNSAPVMYLSGSTSIANGIPSLTLRDKNGTLMAAGTSVSVTVDTTTGTNVYPKTSLTITSANLIPVIDLSSAVTAGTIANGDTVNYRVDYGGETTIVPQTVVASPT